MTTLPIIILNGPSCSGKSTLARAIQSVLPHPALHLDHDAFTAMLPSNHFQRDDRTHFRAQVLDWMLAINRASRALYDNGYAIIIDCLLGRWDVLLDMIETFGETALFIGVKCPVEELERREKQRGDRSIGMARRQNEWVHKADIYDLEIDTSQSTPAACAASVLDYLESPSTPSAFTRLKNLHASGQITYNYFREAPNAKD